MNISLTQSLKKFGVHKLVCLISRRAAGVWSLLPSLACQNLYDLNESANIVLIDFGKRHEMFEHLKVNSSAIFANASLIDANRNDGFLIFDYYRDFILRLSDKKYLGNEYINYVKGFSEEGKNLLLYPYEGINPLARTLDVENVETLKSGLIAIAQKYRPKIMYLTFEGQPERPIFDQKLAGDKLMSFSLDICDILLSLVRTDTITRFNEGIDIPSFLALNQNWESKISLFLTRHPIGADLSKELSSFVIGSSPFFDSIGQSIESGRIPWVDFKILHTEPSKNQEISHYLYGLQNASKFILGLR